MSEAQNLLALDVGERRIGVALANTTAKIASPLVTIIRDGERDVFERIKAIIHEHNIQIVVVGLPRGLEGQETAQTAIARKFADELSTSCSVTVHLQDEALTSVMAKDELGAKNKPYEKGDVDKLAAAFILQDWLRATGAPII